MHLVVSSELQSLRCDLNPDAISLCCCRHSSQARGAKARRRVSGALSSVWKTFKGFAKPSPSLSFTSRKTSSSSNHDYHLHHNLGPEVCAWLQCKTQSLQCFWCKTECKSVLLPCVPNLQGCPTGAHPYVLCIPACPGSATFSMHAHWSLRVPGHNCTSLANNATTVLQAACACREV